MKDKLNQPVALYAVDGTIWIENKGGGIFRSYQIGTFLGIFTDVDEHNRALEAMSKKNGEDDMPLIPVDVPASAMKT